MKFELLDPNVSMSMNVLLIIANILNLVYNIPQMVKTYQLKSTRDFSGWFLFLRILGNFIWVVYSIEVENLLMLINNTVTVIASVFVAYYKVIEIIEDHKERRRKVQDKEDDTREEILDVMVVDNVVIPLDVTGQETRFSAFVTDDEEESRLL